MPAPDALPDPLQEKPQSPHASAKAPARWMNWVYGLLAFVLIVVIGCYYVGAVDMENLGFTHDDGVYAIAGKSLALGKGFKLLHVVGEPAQIKYPFGYPFILAAVWLFMPHFPENLPALNYITIAFTLGACWMTFYWLKRCQGLPGWLALLITAIIPGNFFFLYFYSTVMSEAPYLFFTLLTLWVFHRAAEKGTPLTTRTVIVLVLLSALSFLTRVLGVSLMAAIGTWLLLNRQWKNTLIYGVGCLIFGLFPWFLWVKLNTPAITVFNYPLVNAYSNYGLELFHNVTTSDYIRGLGVALFSLINRLQEVMTPILTNFLKVYPQFGKKPEWSIFFSLSALTTAYLLFGYYLLQTISTLRKSIKHWRFQPSAFSVPGLYLFYYILIITLWNYEDQMARFLTPLLPILWLYFFKPIVRFLPEIGQKFPRPRWKAISALLVTVLICTVAFWQTPNSYRLIWTSRHQHWVVAGKYKWLWGDYKATFRWINDNLPRDAKLSVNSDVVFYLYTNRQTFYTFFASLRRKNGKFTADSIPLLMKGLDHYGVNYLVAEPHMQFRTVLHPVNKVAQDLMDKYPNRFKRLYLSPHGAITIYKILPPEKPPVK